MIRHRVKSIAALVLVFSLCLGMASVSLAATANRQSPAAQQGRFIVTLLGTGMPYPSVKRFGPSTLVQAGSTNLLFDVGRGAEIRLFQMGLIRDDLNAVFLTHLHSDHTVGLPDLYLTGWLLDAAYKHKPAPFVIHGPGPFGDHIGTVKMMKRIKAAYEADETIRIHLPQPDLVIDAHNIKAGVVYNKNGVKVTAFPVHHGNAKPAFGYRVDYDGRSVIMSGDTSYEPQGALLKVGKGADVVIHEVMGGPKAFLQSKKGAGIMRLHTTPQQAGRVFAKIKPALAVYYHIVLLGRGAARPTLSDVVRDTRETYHGPLLMPSEDLTQIVIGPDHHIQVLQPKLGLLPVAPAVKTGPVQWDAY